MKSAVIALIQANRLSHVLDSTQSLPFPLHVSLVCAKLLFPARTINRSHHSASPAASLAVPRIPFALIAYYPSRLLLRIYYHLRHLQMLLLDTVILLHYQIVIGVLLTSCLERGLFGWWRRRSWYYILLIID